MAKILIDVTCVHAHPEDVLSIATILCARLQKKHIDVKIFDMRDKLYETTSKAFNFDPSFTKTTPGNNIMPIIENARDIDHVALGKELGVDTATIVNKVLENTESRDPTVNDLLVHVIKRTDPEFWIDESAMKTVTELTFTISVNRFYIYGRYMLKSLESNGYNIQIGCNGDAYEFVEDIEKLYNSIKY